MLKKTNVVSLHALHEFNKILIHSDEGLESYALDMIAGVALLSSRPQDLDATHELISGADVAVLFVRVGKIGGRTMGKCMPACSVRCFLMNATLFDSSVHHKEFHTSHLACSRGPQCIGPTCNHPSSS